MAAKRTRIDVLMFLTLGMRVAVGKEIDAVIPDDDAGLAAGVAFPHDHGQTTPLLPRASTIVMRARRQP
jgi:hypothetical protein